MLKQLKKVENVEVSFYEDGVMIGLEPYYRPTGLLLGGILLGLVFGIALGLVIGRAL